MTNQQAAEFIVSLYASYSARNTNLTERRTATVMAVAALMNPNNGADGEDVMQKLKGIL